MSENKNVEEVMDGAEAAKSYIEEELVSTAKAVQNTQIWGTAVLVGISLYMFSIAGGFASNLQPKEAAKIAKGLISQKLEDAQPQVEEYLSTEIPKMIESVPEYAKSQLPVYRETVEQSLEDQLHTLASDTSKQLDTALDVFLEENADDFKTIILAGQDKETTDEVAKHMREMFVSYLTESHGETESIQDKLDKSFDALREVELKTDRLAHASDLTASEKKQRRAIASLFTTVQAKRDEVVKPAQEFQKNAQDAVRQVLASNPEH